MARLRRDDSMLSYIANIDTAQLIQKVCKRKNILILNTQDIKTSEKFVNDFLQICKRNKD